jgi:uncharacterized protein (DUF305 family)
MNIHIYRQIVLAIVVSALWVNAAMADEMTGMQHVSPVNADSSINSFVSQMSRSMETMNMGMISAPMNGDPDHDFASMMVPHHQGAVDMAKVELLYGKNPILRRLAQEIIVTQDAEIQIMQSELKKITRPALNANVNVNVK